MKVIVTHNPYNGKKLKEYEKHSSEEVDIILQKSQKIAKNWKNASLEKRCSLLSKLAALLMKKQNSLSELMTKEMGKPIAQSKAEIEKCA
jgi:succinate-semialdehyde dehydrogenase/glutarate-semialdehyde dehydrogenase